MSMSKPAAAETAVPEKQRSKRTKRRSGDRSRRQPRYQVILWDDDDHTAAYVIVMMQELFGYPRERGYQIAVEVDTQGRAAVLTTTREHAELKRDQIHAYGKDTLVAECHGAMSATIEPIEAA